MLLFSINIIFEIILQFDENLKRKSYAIACRPLEGRHDYQNISNAISNVHNEFNLTAPKLMATLTDNARNFVKAFKIFVLNFSDRVFQGNF